MLKEAPSIHTDDWRIIESPNLLTLEVANPDCRTKSLIKMDSVPKTLQSLHTALSQLQEPLFHILESPQPFTNKTRAILSEDSTLGFGHWSVFDANSRSIIRYFGFTIKGQAQTATRQVAVIKGSASSTILDGTVISNSAPAPGIQQPSWDCIAFVTEQQQNATWLPKSCYGSPNLNSQDISWQPFLPNAKIFRISGKHRIDYTCPRTGKGSYMGRGFLVLLSPNQCRLSIDGSLIHQADQAQQSVWMKPITLLDKSTEFPPVQSKTYPTPLKTMITQVANDALLPHIVKASNQTAQQVRDVMTSLDSIARGADEEHAVRTLYDQIFTGTASSAVAVAIGVLLYYMKSKYGNRRPTRKAEDFLSIQPLPKQQN